MAGANEAVRVVEIGSSVMNNLPPTINTYEVVGLILVSGILIYYCVIGFCKYFFDYKKKKNADEIEERLETARINNVPPTENSNVNSQLLSIVNNMQGINDRNTGVTRAEFDTLQQDLRTFQTEMRNRIHDTDEKLNIIIGEMNNKKKK